MTTTYYLLRSNSSAVGDGAYLGTDGDGKVCMVATHGEARRFTTLESAEATIADVGEQFGGLEIEVRNSAE